MFRRTAGAPLRVLLVGYGVRGRQWHDACRRRRGVEIVGAFDPEPEALAEARRRGLRTFESFAAAARHPGTEAAIVSSPPWAHREQAVACLEQGLAVLVEKPLALSVADAAAVASASDEAGRPVVVGQNFRFLERERAIRKVLEAGRIGLPISAVVVSARPPSAARPHLASVAYGPIWDICLHHVDALRLRFRGPPRAVRASVRQVPETSTQTFELSLAWPTGFSVVYRHSEGAPGFYHYEWIEGDRRAILVHDQKVSLFFPGHRPRRVAPPRGPVPEQAVLGDFLLSVRGRHVSALSAADNLATVATVEAAVSSIELARDVEISEIANFSEARHGPGARP